jgi:hypothetical protein
MPQAEITQAVADLRAQVARIPAIRQSIKDAIAGLMAQVEANKDDPAELQALVTEVQSNLDGIANDVVSGTPAAGQS